MAVDCSPGHPRSLKSVRDQFRLTATDFSGESANLGASRWITSSGDVAVKPGSRLILVDKDGELVSEFQLTERDLADPEAFVAALKQSIEHVEEEEP